jgi:hypothetical protein
LNQSRTSLSTRSAIEVFGGTGTRPWRTTPRTT